jgi:PAS domain S-box-containing protein
MSKPSYEELENRIIELLSEKDKLINQVNKRSFYESVIPTAISDENGAMLQVSKSFTAQYGYTLADVPTVDIWFSLAYPKDKYAKEVLESWTTEINASIEENREFNALEFLICCKDGTYKQVEFNCSIDEAISIVSMRDVTDDQRSEQEKHEEKLRADRIEKLLNEAQKLAHIGSWLFNPFTQKNEWSEGMFKLWGFDANDPTPAYDIILSRIHPNDLALFNDVVGKSASLGTPYDIEMRLCLPYNEQRIIRAICQPSFGTAGEVLSLAGTNQDITEQKRVDTEIVKAKEQAEESDRLKSAFLANMSHEIRTPMNGILGFSDLLKRKDLSDEKREKYLNLIDNEGKRLLHIINDLVDISKIDSNSVDINIGPCNINSLIDDFYSKYAIRLRNRGITLQSKKGLEDIGSIIKTDENKLVQILSNLLENAIKFTREGVIEFGYSLSNDDLTFYVKDSGVGIEREEQEDVFDRFTQGKLEQTHNPGVGLGLSIVKGLIEILGGVVRVDSVIGIGSTFSVTIPYENVAIETKINLDISNVSLDEDHFTVLIAEDELIIFMYLEECLSDFNCTILHAENGKQAINLFNENAAIDFILMDINMPEMKGYEALEEIRKIDKEIPIIAQTGLVMAGDKETILAAGFDDYISKPIPRDLLIKTINKHLKKIIA